MTTPRLADPLLTPAQVSEQLQISERTLANARVQQRLLPFVKVGSAVRYRQSSVDAFLAANEHPVLPPVAVPRGRPRH